MADHVHRHRRECVRLTVHADQRTREHVVGEPLDPHGDVTGFDPDSVVVPRTETDGLFAESRCC
ncbi:hypothetical protein [Kocuria nitroreducens]|uniref:hypothetical protein n=1 Tax=Kocuria nitroreducens TaxID=3058914 RepID=UPI0036DBF204